MPGTRSLSTEPAASAWLALWKDRRAGFLSECLTAHSESRRSQATARNTGTRPFQQNTAVVHPIPAL